MEKRNKQIIRASNPTSSPWEAETGNAGQQGSGEAAC